MFLNKIIASAPTVTQQLNLLLEKQDKVKHVPIVENMYDASNTPLKPIFDMSNNSVVKGAENFFKTTDTIINYLTHPVLIVNAIAGASYWICGLICIAGILYYIIGHKNGIKWASGSLLGYTLIQVVNCAANLL